MVDILTKAGRFLGISNREGAQIGAALAAGNLGQAALTTLTSLGGEGRFEKEAVDVSAPPAGVDSPATLSRTSQTSRTLDIYGDERPGVLGGPRPMSRDAFIGGFGVPGIIGQAGRLLSRPGVGGALTGVGAGLGFDVITDMFGNQKKLVITRKLQRDVKKVFMLSLVRS